jgi:hypothetical protein
VNFPDNAVFLSSSYAILLHAWLHASSHIHPGHQTGQGFDDLLAGRLDQSLADLDHSGCFRLADVP